MCPASPKLNIGTKTGIWKYICHPPLKTLYRGKFKGTKFGELIIFEHLIKKDFSKWLNQPNGYKMQALNWVV